ncbi:hypothetical protein RN001_014479 [Aquatica leii]|uniref:Uncharacterized protein n=1 Tax=Aquatica leii TaxID=1421715 RepID=A0AAN7PYJ6_9COLE|nr:hypothetical protein RN001_014479 [Aquatica leii]
MLNIYQNYEDDSEEIESHVEEQDDSQKDQIENEEETHEDNLPYTEESESEKEENEFIDDKDYLPKTKESAQRVEVELGSSGRDLMNSGVTTAGPADATRWGPQPQGASI